MKKLLSLALCAGLVTGSFAQADETLKEVLQEIKKTNRMMEVLIKPSVASDPVQEKMLKKPMTTAQLLCAFSDGFFGLAGATVALGTVYAIIGAASRQSLAGIQVGLGPVLLVGLPSFCLGTVTYSLGNNFLVKNYEKNMQEYLNKEQN